MPALMRAGIFAVAGGTALSLAACSHSNTAAPPPQSANPSSSAPAPTQAPAQGQQHVVGLIASVSGDTIQVTQSSGTATVDFTASTKVTELTSAGLPDVTPGSCVTVRPTRESSQNGGNVTAAAVRISQAVDGKCEEPPKPPVGGPPPADGPSGGPVSGPPPDGPPGGPASGPPPAPVWGTVASVASDTITVNTTGSSPQTTVTVSDKTKYTKQAEANSQAIAQGKCISAKGSENSGTLQATTIELRAANNGKCPEPGGPPQGQGG